MAKLLRWVLPILLACGPAAAFEVDKFRSGMTEAEVMDIAQADGLQRRTEDNDVTLYRDGKRQYAFEFCDDRLNAFGKYYEPTLDTLMTLVFENSKLYMEPEARSEVEKDGTGKKSLIFEFPLWERDITTVRLVTAPGVQALMLSKFDETICGPKINPSLYRRTRHSG